MPPSHLPSVTPEWTYCPRRPAGLAGEAWSKTTTSVSSILPAEHVDPAMATAVDRSTANLEASAGKLPVWHPGDTADAVPPTHPSTQGLATSRTGSGPRPAMSWSANFIVTFNVIFSTLSMIGNGNKWRINIYFILHVVCIIFAQWPPSLLFV